MTKTLLYTFLPVVYSVGDPDPDPQIRDPDPRIFTGIQIRKGSAIICHADLICGS